MSKLKLLLSLSLLSAGMLIASASMQEARADNCYGPMYVGGDSPGEACDMFFCVGDEGSYIELGGDCD